MASTEEALNNQYSSTMNEDSVNPFFHSSSDNNIVQLVFEKLIGGKNYFPWARLMIILLTAKHKIGFIDGTIPVPIDRITSLTHGLNLTLETLQSPIHI